MRVAHDTVGLEGIPTNAQSTVLLSKRLCTFVILLNQLVYGTCVLDQAIGLHAHILLLGVAWVIWGCQ